MVFKLSEINSSLTMSKLDLRWSNERGSTSHTSSLRLNGSRKLTSLNRTIDEICEEGRSKST